VADWTQRRCSADFQSAVSRISNPLQLSLVLRVADWKSTTQQVGNLRYEAVKIR
jgi:hypothetical protein